MNETPPAASRRFASSRRANGYVPSSVRTGERRTGRLDRIGAQEPLQRLERPLHRSHLDALLARVGVARLAGAEVDGVDAPRGEVGDVRPGLLRLDRVAARCTQALDLWISERDPTRRRARQDLGAGQARAEMLDGLLRCAMRREPVAV